MWASPTRSSRRSVTACRCEDSARHDDPLSHRDEARATGAALPPGCGSFVLTSREKEWQRAHDAQRGNPACPSSAGRPSVGFRTPSTWNISIGGRGGCGGRGRKPHNRGAQLDTRTDHPMGGGEGPHGGRSHPCSKTGVPAQKGGKTPQAEARLRGRRRRPAGSLPEHGVISGRVVSGHAREAKGSVATRVYLSYAVRQTGPKSD